MLKRIPYRYRVLLLLFSLTAITYMDRICISLVGVRIKSDLGLNNAQFGLVLGSFALAYALFEIPSGIWGDRIGPKAVLIRIVFCWSLFTAFTGLANGLLSLIIIRFLFGAGESGAYPNATAVIARWLPFKESGKGISALTIGANTGSALAPLIIIPLASLFGWRIPFFVIGFIGFFWVLLCFFWFQNFPSEMKGISKKEKIYIENNRQFNTRHAIQWNSIYKDRNLLALVIMFSCSQWANYFFIGWLPVYLQQGRHISENEMKLITSSVFLITIPAGILSGIISDWLVKRRGLKFARRSLGKIALGMMGIMILIIALSTNKTTLIFCLFAGHLFMPFSMIVSFSTCIDLGGENTGSVTGIMNFFGQLAAFFLLVSFGKVVDATHNFNAPLFGIAGVLFLGSLLWFVIDPTKKIKIIEPGFILKKTIIPLSEFVQKME